MAVLLLLGAGCATALPGESRAHTPSSVVDLGSEGPVGAESSPPVESGHATPDAPAVTEADEETPGGPHANVTTSMDSQGPPSMLGWLPFPEASGVVASRAHPGVFWTHADGGSGERDVLHALRVEDGRLVDVAPGQTFRTIAVTGAQNTQWEDIAADAHGNLWIGDVGNNDCRRGELAIHRIAEPNPASANVAPVAATYRVRWPDPPGDCRGRDAEALFVMDGVPHLIAKDGSFGVYRLTTLSPTAVNRLEKVAELDPPVEVDTLVTGADLSPDASTLAVAFGRTTLALYRTTGAAGPGPQVGTRLARAPSVVVPYRTDARPEWVEGIAFHHTALGLLMVSEARRLLYLPGR